MKFHHLLAVLILLSITSCDKSSTDSDLEVIQSHMHLVCAFDMEFVDSHLNVLTDINNYEGDIKVLSITGTNLYENPIKISDLSKSQATIASQWYVGGNFFDDPRDMFVTFKSKSLFGNEEPHKLSFKYCYPNIDGEIITEAHLDDTPLLKGQLLRERLYIIWPQ